MNTRQLGKIGEDVAAKYLQNNGVRIIKRNYYTKFGEIDLIGIENQTIIFTEVKLRRNNFFGFPSESVNLRKLKRIKKTAQIYLYENHMNNVDCRFDLICLYFQENEQSFKIEWFKNNNFDWFFFELRVLYNG